jgi:hypothetical protein
MRTLGYAALLSLSFALGCSGSNTNKAADAAGTTAAGAAQQGADAAGASLGIKDTVIKVAMDTARSYLGQKASPTVNDKEEAARQGVDAAVVQAKTEGQELDTTQRSGLREMLKKAL